MTNVQYRWMMAVVALIICLLLGWYAVLEVAVAIALLSALVTMLIRTRERRPGEGWVAWCRRTWREVTRQHHAAGLHSVLLSCGHRGWVQSHEPPQPGNAAYCCHRRFGPAEEAEVVATGVKMYGYHPTIIRMREESCAR